MLYFKYLEIKHQKSVLLKKFTDNTNHKFYEYRNRFMDRVKSINRKNLVNLLIWIMHFLFLKWKALVEKTKTFLLKYHYVRYIVDAVKGKYELNKKREASSFLRQIEKDKDL